MTSLLNDSDVEFFVDDNNIRLCVVEVLNDELKLDSEIDASVRQTIESYSKVIKEGTPEWDIIYEKHYRETVKRKRGI
jgi:hypothetical protein